MESPASQFYTGLVSELYEPLRSHTADADDYAPFLDNSGEPALELGCGAGTPLLELLRRGYEVDGVDSSADMLERCREEAKKLGLEPALHHQEMQSLSLERRYRSIFLAGPTFTLLTSDADASDALARMHEHLLPGGWALIPLTLPDLEAAERLVGRFREAAAEDGTRLRVGAIDLRVDRATRSARTRLRYERVHPDGRVDTLERDWVVSWWEQDHFHALLAEAGFVESVAVDPGGGRALPDASVFVFLARKPLT